MNGKFLIKIILIALAIIAFGGYTYYQTKDLIAGPQIEINSPRNGSGTSEELIEINGVAKNISRISMNNLSIYTDQNGVFKEKFLLAEGYNIIELSASDRFGRTKNKKLEIVYLK